MLRTRRQFIKNAAKSTSGLLLAGAPAAMLASNASAMPESAEREFARAMAAPDNNDAGNCSPLLTHALRPLMGSEKQPLCAKYSDHVLLFVNTASRCGFTPQFEGLEQLYQRYSARGFEVLGFPSGDFRQELESEAEVAEFCEINYGVSFPMFEKIHVTGDQAHPLYSQLSGAVGKPPAWNFNKYVVDRSGKVVAHFGSGTKPMSADIVNTIEALL